MAHRLLDVTAKTSLPHVEATAEGPDWTVDGVATVDVGVPRDADAARLSLERDPLDDGKLPHHADRVALSAADARTLADDLHRAADALEAGEAMVSGRSR